MAVFALSSSEKIICQYPPRSTIEETQDNPTRAFNMSSLTDRRPSLLPYCGGSNLHTSAMTCFYVRLCQHISDMAFNCGGLTRRYHVRATFTGGGSSVSMLCRTADFLPSVVLPKSNNFNIPRRDQTGYDVARSPGRHSSWMQTV